MYDIDRMKEEIRIKDVCDMLGITLGKRSGANIFGSIRNERTGSFSINPEKNIWRDWGTGEGGSIIDLVMKVENVDKGKAIQRLAEHFNFQNETSSNKNYNSQLPTKKQFAEIGIISDRAISNFDLDLQKQSLEKLEELEKKYSISISELSKKNPQLYTKVLEKKALPLILSERNLLIDTISKYQKENTPLNREFIKSQIKELEESLNSKIDIYNKARIDDLNRDNLKINIYNKLPDESITVDFKEVYTFKYDVLHTVKDLLPYELSIGIGDDYYSTNLMIDKENGEALGLEITEQYTMEDYYKIIGTEVLEAFIDKFYIEPLWEEFSQVVVNDKFEENGDSTLAEDFHIWKAETKIDDIKDWFEAHYNKELYQLEERTPLNFLDKSELDDTHVTISFDSKGTEYPQEIPNEEIEDMEAVREWLDTLDNNDSLLLKDDISHYLIHKSPKHEDGYQVSVFQDEALTKLNMDMQYPSKYALAKSLAVANDFEIIDSYTLSPIDNLTDRQESLDDELQKLEDNIRNLDFKINTYSNDLSENKGKYHLYSKDDTLIGTTNTKKEAKKVAQDIYLKTSGSVDVKNLKEEIPKLKEEVANARALYDTKLAEYKGILEYTNPYNPKIINEPPISSNILTQNNNNTSNNLKDEFISRLKDYGFKEEELEEFFDNTFDVRKINNEIEKAMFQAGTTEKIVENMVSTCVYADYSSDIDGTTTYSESVLWYKELVKDDVIKLAENEKLSYSELIDKLNPNNNVNEPHRYYLTQRPPSIGTHPNGALKTVSFDNKQNFEGVNCWGYVEYENPLTEAQINDYELTEKKSYIYEINGENINLANENLKDIEYFKTTKNLSLDDGSRIRKGTSFIVEDGNDNGYEVRFEINDKNRYSNDTAEYVFTKDDILSLSEPEIELVNQKYSETDKNEILSKEINEIEENILTQNYIDKEIGDFMEEIKQAPLIDMKVDKDVDVSEILDNLKNGVGNIFNNESFIQYLNFQSQFHNYSPSNNMLIAIQNPQATNVASFTKWKSMGRTVNKGEKGIMILAPNVVKNGSKEIFARLDKYGKTNVNRYTFTKTNNSYNISITSNGKIVKNGLSKNELDNFIKVNKLNQTSIRGFRKTYVFDISQTSGQPVPQFKLNKLNDNDLLDNNGFYKNPLINVNISEGGIFEENQTLTFKQANEIYERKEKEIRALKQEYEAKGEYYPYLKQKFDVILKPNAPLDGVSRDIRADIGDGEYNNLLEALKGEMKGYPQVFDTLEKTLASNENTMETILAIKNQLENTVNSKNIDLEYTTATGKANGYFAPMENKICVNSEMSLSQTTKTLLHEYVHSQLHKDGIEAKDNLVGRQTAEIEAEATTYVVSKHFGFDTSEYSFDYVSTWARGKDVAELGQTLKTIKEASEKIINEIKAPLELELYNNRENIEEILKSQNVKPNDKIINNMIDINKETGKINTISDLSNAEKFKSYDNQELNNKISDTNKEIATNTVKVEVKTVTVGIER